MPNPKKIVLIWLVGVTLFAGSFALPHQEFGLQSFVSYSIQFLLFILSLYLIKHETVRKTKLIFLNFAALFSVSILFHLYNFVGTVIFASEPWARLYYFQYVSAGLYFFLLTFAICYLTVDVLFRDFRAMHKYLLTLAIVGGFFAYYYHPYFVDKRYLYTTVEIREWKELDNAATEFQRRNGTMPNAPQLVQLLSASDATMLGRLREEDRSERVNELYPYLTSDNYLTLLFKPLYLNSIYMCMACVGLILLFFGYLYRKDPPQGAYIEKMMFFFLIFCSLEIFHAWSLIKTIEWESSRQIIDIGQFLSAAILAVIAVFFALRLKFITSVYGEFYEHEIVERPNAVTRWRDALDNLVIAHFFNRNEVFGRLFVDPKLKNQ